MTERWQKYRKKGTTEMREVTVDEICIEGKLPDNVSISEADRKAGSPKAGDMIARNPENHDDQWLVSAEYHEANYERVDDHGLSQVELIIGQVKRVCKREVEMGFENEVADEHQYLLDLIREHEA